MSSTSMGGEVSGGTRQRDMYGPCRRVTVTSSEHGRLPSVPQDNPIPRALLLSSRVSAGSQAWVGTTGESEILRLSSAASLGLPAKELSVHTGCRERGRIPNGPSLRQLSKEQDWGLPTTLVGSPASYGVTRVQDGEVRSLVQRLAFQRKNGA